MNKTSETFPVTDNKIKQIERKKVRTFVLFFDDLEIENFIIIIGYLWKQNKKKTYRRILSLLLIWL